MKFMVEVFSCSSITMEHRGEKFSIDQDLSSAKRKMNHFRCSNSIKVHVF
jgi:hypothetical protein